MDIILKSFTEISASDPLSEKERAWGKKDFGYFDKFEIADKRKDVFPFEKSLA